MKKRIMAWILAACAAFSLTGLPASAAETDSPATTTDAPAAESVGAVENPFTDVNADSPFLPGILYAVENGITKGTTPVTFSPYSLCTRAQIIAFLWRAWGSPEPTIDNPFDDVKPEAYYYKAALWSYEKGLVGGTSFDAYSYCTRLETVTYLWKLSDAPEAYENHKDAFPFTDIGDDTDALNAIAWASMDEAITNGTTETTFSPDKRCTRAQIVTFIYRARNLFEAA